MSQAMGLILVGMAAGLLFLLRTFQASLLGRDLYDFVVFPVLIMVLLAFGGALVINGF